MTDVCIHTLDLVVQLPKHTMLIPMSLGWLLHVSDVNADKWNTKAGATTQWQIFPLFTLPEH